jgi:hypothetical protein
VDGILLVQDRIQWQVLVGIVMFLRVRYKAGNFLATSVTHF